MKLSLDCAAQWLNTLVGEAWPFYDRAICEIIKETVTPIMDQYKPPIIIKSMYFKNLTFGDAPMQIDNVWIEQEAENHILMEVSLSVSHCWCHVSSLSTG